VVAGFVFTVLTEPYLAAEYGPDFVPEAPVKLVHEVLYGMKRFPDEQVRQPPIRISSGLPAACTHGCVSEQHSWAALAMPNGRLVSLQYTFAGELQGG
jgi:hypothetical protein